MGIIAHGTSPYKLCVALNCCTIGIPDQYSMVRGWSSDGILKSVYRNTLSEENKKFSDQANSHFEALL